MSIKSKFKLKSLSYENFHTNSQNYESVGYLSCYKGFWVLVYSSRRFYHHVFRWTNINDTAFSVVIEPIIIFKTRFTIEDYKTIVNKLDDFIKEFLSS